MGAQLMAIAAEGPRQRYYLPPNEEHEKAADVPRPDDVPEAELPEQALGFRVQGYGMRTWADLFTNRQLTTLTTFSDLVREARVRAIADGAEPSYADAVATYLGLTFSRIIERNSTVCSWDSHPSKEQVRGVFARQAIAMTWDFAESNVFAESSGSLGESADWVSTAVARLPASSRLSTPTSSPPPAAPPRPGWTPPGSRRSGSAGSPSGSRGRSSWVRRPR